MVFFYSLASDRCVLEGSSLHIVHQFLIIDTLLGIVHYLNRASPLNNTRGGTQNRANGVHMHYPAIDHDYIC